MPPRPVPVLSRPVRGYPGRLIATGLGYLIVLTLTAAGFVATRGGQRLDGRLVPRSLWGGGYPDRTRLVGPSLTLLSWVGDPVVVATGLLSVVLLGVAIRRPWAGLAGVGALLCSVAGSTVLKRAIPRPDLGVAGSTVHNSFPSGHVAAATGLVLAFLLVVPARARWWLAAPGAMGVSAVAAATMIVDWHRFSDALGAVALASMMCCLAAAALALWPGDTRVGAAQVGATRDGAAQVGTTRDGAARDGTARDGTARDGTAQGGAARDGAARDGVGAGAVLAARHGAPLAQPCWDARSGRHGVTPGPAGGLGWAALVAVTGTVGVSVAAAALPLDPDLFLAVAAVGGFTAVSMAAIVSALSVTAPSVTAPSVTGRSVTRL
ncbi:MAG TPA: phosphatase PAP2 family protein [Rugosimonospora sp.]